MEAILMDSKVKSSNLTNYSLEVFRTTNGTITDDDYSPFLGINSIFSWLNPFNIPKKSAFHSVTSASGSTVPFDFITQERTDVVFSDFEFEQLSAAATVQNENRFCEVADTINWKFRSPGDFVTAVQLGLTAGAYQKAFQLTQMGITLYPDHTELQKFASILTPAKVKREIQPSQPDGTKDIQWLKVHRSEYTGQWVALLRGELLGTAPTLKELIRQVGNPKGTQILVTQVN